MPDRQQIARDTAAGLRAFAERVEHSPVVIGFDGFVDSIIKVVDKRHDPERYDPIATIDQLGRKIAAAAGHSSNYELVTTLEKLGGNGPIMADAMAALGTPVTYIGALGYPTLHPVFEPLQERARVISFCEPGFTDALEFEDGKLMLGKHGSLREVNAERLREVVGDDRLNKVLGSARMLGMVNWTMLTRMGEIWAHLIEDVLPRLDEPASGRRWVFIDLADPEKRNTEDIEAALRMCGRFQERADVICGFNLKEAVQVAGVLGVETGDETEAAIETMARGIREKLGVHTVVVHPRAGAAAAAKTPEGTESGCFHGPLVRSPRLSTGAGDNFNAGFCLGRLAELPIDQSLCAGTAVSGFYVRHAKSPSLTEVADFCDNLPEPE